MGAMRDLRRRVGRSPLTTPWRVPFATSILLAAALALPTPSASAQPRQRTRRVVVDGVSAAARAAELSQGLVTVAITLPRRSYEATSGLEIARVWRRRGRRRTRMREFTAERQFVARLVPAPAQRQVTELQLVVSMPGDDWRLGDEVELELRRGRYRGLLRVPVVGVFASIL